MAGETDIHVWGREPFGSKTAAMADLMRECIRLGVSVPAEVKSHLDVFRLALVPNGESFRPERHLTANAFTRQRLNESGLVEWYPKFHTLSDGTRYQACLVLNCEKIAETHKIVDVTFSWGGGGFKLYP